MDLAIELRADRIPQRHAIRLDDHAALDGAAVGEVAEGDDVLVPLRVVLGARRDRRAAAATALAAAPAALLLLLLLLLRGHHAEPREAERWRRVRVAQRTSLRQHHAPTRSTKHHHQSRHDGAPR